MCGSIPSQPPIEIAAWGRFAPADRLRGRRCASAEADARPQAHLLHTSVCRRVGDNYAKPGFQIGTQEKCE